MPPQRGNGRLDDISEAIGRLDGRFEGVERYIHERQHEIKGISSKIDGLAHQLSKDIAAVEARMEVRLRALENAQNSETAIKRVGVWLIQTIIAVVAAVGSLQIWHARP